MAAPTVTDLTAITTEGLKKAGYNSPTSALLTRAQTYWIREIKSDVARRLTKPLTFQVISTIVTVNGQSRYSNPSDFASDMTLVAMHGLKIGTAANGASGSVTLQSGHGYSESDIIGKEIFIYSGTGVNSLSQCTGLSGDVVSVTPNWTTAPVNGSKYMIVEQYIPLIQTPIWDRDNATIPTVKGQPTHYCLYGDADYGEFELYPVPYDTTVPYGLKMRYYADLKTLDVASTALATFYKKYETLFIQGVYYKALQDINDDREMEAKIEYKAHLFEVAARESYGSDLSNLQIRILDY